MFASLALAALLIEAITGYPDALFRRIGHPVTWIGALISRLDRDWKRESASDGAGRLAGMAAVFVLVSAGAGSGFLAQQALFWLVGPGKNIVGILDGHHIILRAMNQEPRYFDLR